MKVKKSDGWDVHIDELALNPAEILNLALYGIPSPRDERGHTEKINFRVPPAAYDRLEMIRQLYPPSWIKNNSQLYRCLMAVGMKVMLVYARARESKEEIDELDKHLKMMNYISKAQHIESMEEDYINSRKYVLEKKNINLDDIKMLQDAHEAINNVKATFKKELKSFEK